ncbi:chromosomal replication initiator protein DnaA [Pasteurella atlantica]|uniref:chromosomal replication initiator protein DnaA n=1 Tax=Pasteurellaceae TaxID=712 RepID=UPI00277072C8|nr:chromosomal replication initiator protein DnaA [Pasteurella atlantica]MDP8033390.1 chromosomal replication initiator protein DnaA [Pasteurella atlantica]MDP8035326.1 chromosomal replication initiator protein DnaA [Pasteurella atlantica]MDP8037276.1 chromosomal replication initiator protein DnaA [Pasteurella atlantica]MDP8047610.1 chromosomal replication initiator protein DnaA [Pasteurella atlantica]MDP8049579.1 chromosomal replication initiator protein DnaA [Pasteurella atlantica]
MSSLWRDTLDHLQTKVSSQEFNAWLRPLQATLSNDQLTLYAHNSFIIDWVQNKYLSEITELVRFLSKNDNLTVVIREGKKPVETEIKTQTQSVSTNKNEVFKSSIQTGLLEGLTFDNFVQGKSNQLALSIAQSVVENIGESYCNPFSLYGSTGLGKTHLLHAIGNEILKNNPDAKVVYIHSERFLQNMINALQNRHTIEKFKQFYRSLDVLMIDDIQFFANKVATQEEFFHTFNTLFERSKQIVVASDVFPKNIQNIEERIRSRLSWGVNAAIEPPELETRVAILMKKAEERGERLEENVALFLAQKLRTNVRELEGALNRVIAWRNFTKRPITIDAVREALKDLMSSYEHLITIENIQKTVAERYNIKISDLKSKSRKQMFARPRQIAMALAKELTNHSLPEIGREFGGKDHTTVMHAIKRINELMDSDSNLREDYINLTRKLSS